MIKKHKVVIAGVCSVLVIGGVLINYIKHTPINPTVAYKWNKFNEKFGLELLMNYNEFRLNTTESRNVYIVDKFNSSFSRDFASSSESKINAIVNFIPVFDGGQFSIIQNIYCLDNKQGETLRDYLTGFFVAQNKSCDISKITNLSEKLIALQIESQYPIFVFDTGDIVYNIKNANPELINQFLSVTKPKYLPIVDTTTNMDFWRILPQVSVLPKTTTMVSPLHIINYPTPKTYPLGVKITASPTKAIKVNNNVSFVKSLKRNMVLINSVKLSSPSILYKEYLKLNQSYDLSNAKNKDYSVGDIIQKYTIHSDYYWTNNFYSKLKQFIEYPKFCGNFEDNYGLSPVIEQPIITPIDTVPINSEKVPAFISNSINRIFNHHQKPIKVEKKQDMTITQYAPPKVIKIKLPAFATQGLKPAN